MTHPAWHVEQQRGDAGAFHTRPLSHRRSATFFSTDRPVLVLGSAQPIDGVDVGEARQLGIDVVRRRSGGGGVLLLPDEHVWLDIEIPASDPLWSEDVGRAAWWVGELWAAVLGDAALDVHHGRLVAHPWSTEVCFAGVGPGEVVEATGAKLVGLSQRRTRGAARFQTVIHRVWRAELVESLGAPPRPVGPLPPVAVTDIAADELVARLTAALADR